jgi:hypothetical protein
MGFQGQGYMSQEKRNSGVGLWKSLGALPYPGVPHGSPLLRDILAVRRGTEAMKKIFVTVSGGCAYVMEDTVPSGYELEVIDFDNIQAGDDFPSPEAREYCLERGLYER